MIIDNFNKENLKSLRVELDKELKSLGDRFGILFHLNGITFTKKKFRCKLEGVTSNKDESFMEVEFKENAYRYGLNPDDFGKLFSSNDNVYRIVGLKVKNRKYPIIAENVGNDRNYKFPAHVVKNEMDKLRGKI